MKNNEILLDELGEAGEAFVPELPVKQKKHGILSRAAIGGACAAAIACAVIIPVLHRSGTDTVSDSSSNQDAATVIEPDHQGSSQPDEPAAEGLYIPAVELPESADISTYDMIALVVYQGQIYTDAGIYDGDEAEKLMPLAGERLGTAKGNIDEWSKQEDYATEFAGTVAGEVYSVNGYDPGFRLCVCGEAEDEMHNQIRWIHFLECLNGITITKGSDMFEDRLHISERTETVQYQNHDDWNNGIRNYQTPEIDENIWNEFIEQVNNCDFINTWNPELKGDETIYHTPNQAHLILSMNDGTAVNLRLIEGGYVGYAPLGWYFVKIPEDIFNAVYEACGGTH